MLDTATKKRIDDARNILVGKVPDPKSQVEQITIALIYKFMDDMDKEAEELGGKTKFFTGDYERYSWTKIFDPRLGGFELIAMYGEALDKMNLNPNIPQLFRDIFKNAYLPYRDPETLKLFLKTINEFHYSHSEKLGDAFEYLLSVLGSQGDAGQFRTPRHIIDFIIKVVDPKKNDTILDPACGTAGFLISAYKHIIDENTKERKGDLLLPEERTKLTNNITGYDISPDMVRLSLVNMYLHGFATPLIYEYDTLGSEERWNEYYDVIMANPPFMSPTGGVKPHKRFSIQAKRSEVLFVDYMLEHLTPNGKAGIIVPEGIIFQSGNAYKQLRKMLVDNYLWAVVSLPAGVFNPYSGVKTSILLIDKQLNKKSDSILFVKIESDGFDLGAQRRGIEKNDLTESIKLLLQYKESLISPITFSFSNNNLLLIEKNKIASKEEYNLSIDRYRINVNDITSKYEYCKLGEVCKVMNGRAYKQEELLESGKYPVLRVGNFFSNRGWYYSDLELEEDKYCANGDLLYAWSASFGPKIWDGQKVIYHYHIWKMIPQEDMINKHFLYYVLDRETEAIKSEGGRGIAMIHITKANFEQREIPLPPLSVQQEIVAKIESYQAIINGAKQVVDNYKPQIDIDPEWEIVALGELCEIVRGSSPRPKGDPKYYGGTIPRLLIADITRDGMFVEPKIDSLTKEGAKLSRPMKKGDVVLAVSANVGLTSILKVDACIHDGFVGFRNLNGKLLPEFLYYCLMKQKVFSATQSIGAIYKNLTSNQVSEFLIPFPPLEEQKQIVSQIEREQKLVDANKELIKLYEQKIKDEINKVWEK